MVYFQSYPWNWGFTIQFERVFLLFCQTIIKQVSKQHRVGDKNQVESGAPHSRIVSYPPTNTMLFRHLLDDFLTKNQKFSAKIQAQIVL